MGIPFLMFMSESIFFEGAKLFHYPGRLQYALIFIWLVFLWLASEVLRNKEKNKASNSKNLNILDLFIMGLIIITFIGLGTTIFNYSVLTDVFKEFVVLLSLFATYFIIKTWSSHNHPELLEKFLFSLVIVNSIASFLYILHQGLHLKIYQQEEYLRQIFYGEEITRSSWFMPQFLFFSIAFCLIQWKKNPFLFTMLIVLNLLATFITYFRSFSIIAVILFLFYFLLTGFKKGRIGLVLRNVILFSVFGVLFFIFLLKVFPTNTKYLMDRFSEITNPRLARGPNNLEVRFTNTGFIISRIDNSKKILGMGPVTQNQIPWLPHMRLITSDMVWTEVIFRWGYIGLILFGLLYIYSTLRAFNIYMNSKGVLSNLALLFLLYVFTQIIQSFIDWTFLSGHGYTIGLWYFGMLSAVAGYSIKEGLSEEKLLPDE